MIDLTKPRFVYAVEGAIRMPDESEIDTYDPNGPPLLWTRERIEALRGVQPPGTKVYPVEVRERPDGKLEALIRPRTDLAEAALRGILCLPEAT